MDRQASRGGLFRQFRGDAGPTRGSKNHHGHEQFWGEKGKRPHLDPKKELITGRISGAFPPLLKSRHRQISDTLPRQPSPFPSQMSPAPADSGDDPPLPPGAPPGPAGDLARAHPGASKMGWAGGSYAPGRTGRTLDRQGAGSGPRLARSCLRDGGRLCRFKRNEAEQKKPGAPRRSIKSAGSL